VKKYGQKEMCQRRNGRPRMDTCFTMDETALEA